MIARCRVADAVLIVLLAVVVAAAVLVMRNRARRGSACCGERDEAPARVRVADRDKSHYPYETELSIGGMTCENCAIKVENALNALPGTWAAVSIGSHAARVRTTGEPDIDAMRAAVREAGYVVLAD